MRPLATRQPDREPTGDAIELAELFEQAAQDLQEASCLQCIRGVILQALRELADGAHDKTDCEEHR